MSGSIHMFHHDGANRAELTLLSRTLRCHVEPLHTRRLSELPGSDVRLLLFSGRLVFAESGAADGGAAVRAPKRGDASGFARGRIRWRVAFR